jgi:hypothetical protein
VLAWYHVSIKFDKENQKQERSSMQVRQFSAFWNEDGTISDNMPEWIKNTPAAFGLRPAIRIGKTSIFPMNLNISAESMIILVKLAQEARDQLAERSCGRQGG